MGKNEEHGLGRSEPPDLEAGDPWPCTSLCSACSMVSQFPKHFSFRCVFFLILGFSVLLPGIFWILPLRSIKYNFDAKAAIKSSATVQASFTLQKPVSELIPLIERLEYDISSELSIPGAKVAVLSMHHSFSANRTDVVFGVIADPVNVPIAPISLGLLRSSLIELYLKETNLSLTTSLFGQPSEFEILKFNGGLTIVPSQSFPVGQLPEILFNFTLNNSISDIEDNFSALRGQLEFGLNLGPHEDVFVKVTSKNGSTVNPSVVIQVSILTDAGLLLQRLKQLAQVISDSPVRNLGLNNSIFGKVKSISLSSYLNGSLNEYAPTASPAPSPEPSTPYPTASSPCFNCKAGSPQSVNRNTSEPPQKSSSHHSFAPSLPPVTSHSTYRCPYSRQAVAPSLSPESDSNQIPNAPATSPHPELPPHFSSLPAVSYGSRPSEDMGSTKSPVSPMLAPSSLAEPPNSVSKEILTDEGWLMGIFGLWMLHLLFW